MAWIAGVDGCKGGWIAVYEETASRTLTCRIVKKFEDVFGVHYPPLAAVAVDMPIGLWAGGGRACDKAARGVLGKRSSSIFSAPAAGVLDLFCKMSLEERKDPRAYACANKRNRERTGEGNEKDGKGLSRQSWALVPKIAEVDDYLRSPIGALKPIYEVHPEVSFAAMNACENDGACQFNPMEWHKATFGGSAERRALLRHVFGNDLEELEATAAKLVGKRAALDDFYDALACLWTARRIYKETCGYLPKAGGPYDAKGLPMRIVY